METVEVVESKLWNSSYDMNAVGILREMEEAGDSKEFEVYQALLSLYVEGKIGAFRSDTGEMKFYHVEPN